MYHSYNSDLKIESLLTYTNQIIKCSNTRIKGDEYNDFYSNYDFMRMSFFEVEKNLSNNILKLHNQNDLIESIKQFENNHSSLPKLEYYYNCDDETKIIHSITIKYINHLDNPIEITLLFNKEIIITDLLETFVTKIKDQMRKIDVSDLNQNAKSKKGFNFNEMYELIIYLWNRSNRKLSLKPIDYYMTERDMNGKDKMISGFYLENNMHVLFKNKIKLTDISDVKINLKKTFNPFEAIQLNKINKSIKSVPKTIQKLHNKSILYELFIREFARAIQIVDKQGYTKNNRRIPYEIGNIVWINEKGWKLGIIRELNLTDHRLFNIEYKNQEGNIILKKSVHVNDIFVSYKIAIYNIVNKQLVSIFDKIKSLNELFNKGNGVIFRKYFAISNKQLDTYRYKKSKGQIKNSSHYNHIVCNRHKTKSSCIENEFCKWTTNDNNPSISAYDKFKLIIREEYEYECKLFLLRAYYSND